VTLRKVIGGDVIIAGVMISARQTKPKEIEVTEFTVEETIDK